MPSKEEIIASRFNAITDAMAKISGEMVTLKQEVISLELEQDKIITELNQQLIATIPPKPPTKATKK